VTGPEAGEKGVDAFAICIQGGAVLTVLGLYYKLVIRMIKGAFGQDPEGLKLAIAVIVGWGNFYFR
jgi:undecaprenyl-diphosphatase